MPNFKYKGSPGRPRVKKSVCRKCRQSMDHVPFVTLKGEPTGICRACKSFERRVQRIQKNYEGYPTKSGNYLFKQNQSILPTLSPGTYYLYYRHSLAVAGTLTMMADCMVVHLDRRFKTHVLTIDFKNTAFWLANLGMVVGKKAYKQKRFDIAKDVEPKDVRELVAEQDSFINRKLIQMEIARLYKKLVDKAESKQKI